MATTTTTPILKTTTTITTEIKTKNNDDGRTMMMVNAVDDDDSVPLSALAKKHGDRIEMYLYINWYIPTHSQIFTVCYVHSNRRRCDTV